MIREFPDGRAVHRFEFEVIKLWESSTDEIKERGLPGLLTLLPLTRNGARREVVEEVVARLAPPGEAPKRDLLVLAYGLASLAFGKNWTEQVWLERRFAQMYDILGDTPAFQDIKRLGREEGLKEGQEEARKRSLEVLRQTLLHIVDARFPKLTRIAKGQAAIIDDLEELDGLIVKMSIARDAKEARRYLLDEAEDDLG